MADAEIKDPSHWKKRAPTVANTAAYGYTTGIVVATIHWIAKGYHPGSGIDWKLPDDALIEMWVFMILPTVHLIGRIVNNHLTKWAGEDESP